MVSFRGEKAYKRLKTRPLKSSLNRAQFRFCSMPNNAKSKFSIEYLSEFEKKFEISIGLESRGYGV
jgi:hypothetical protein